MDITLLSNPAYHRKIPAGQQVVGMGEMYIVVSGGIEKISLADLKIAGTLAPGDMFGVKELFMGIVGSGSTLFRAAEDTTLFVLSEANFVEVAQNDPLVLYEILRGTVAPETLPPAAKQPEPQAARQPEPQAAKPPEPPSAAQPEPQAVKPPEPPAVKEPEPQIAKPPEPQAAKKAKPPAAKPPEPPAVKPPAVKPPATKPPAAAQVPSTVTVGKGSFFPEGHAGYPGIVKPEYKTYTYMKEYKCPGCMKAFRTPKIFESKIKTAKPMRYDLREYHIDFQMEWYDVIVCPHCYFTALATLFEGSRNFLRVRLKDVMPDVTGVIRLDFEAERDLDFVFAAHYLALRCAGAYVNHRQITAKLWSDISWLYEDAQDDAMARYAAAKAAEAYQNFYMEKNMTPTQEMMLSLATAGMLYRAGDLKDIRKWLFQVKTSKVNNKVYTDLADDLIELAKVEA